MGTERELKFRIPRGALPQLARHPLLRLAQRLPRRSLRSWYFDTPGGELAAAGLALRLRDGEPGRVLTVKSAPGDALGSQRGEWEWAALDSPACDQLGAQDLRQALSDTPLRALAFAPEQLLPILGTEFLRSRWLLDWQGTRLELAIDRGRCVAPQASGSPQAALCELEIEVLQGSFDAAWDLAWTLAQDLPLLLSPVHKAQRAAALRAGGLPEAPAEPGAPAPRSSLQQAMEQWLQTACAQLAVWAEHIAQGDDAHCVHQFRVVLRRLRTALRWLAQDLPPGAAPWLRGELRWAHQLAGLVRDIDVERHWLEQVESAAARAAAARRLQALQRRRMQALRVLRAYLLGARFGRLLLALGRCGCCALRGDSGSDALRRLGRRALREDTRRWKRALRDCRQLLRSDVVAEQLSAQQTAQLHALRIASKRLRLSCERLGALAGGQRAEALPPLRRLATALQDRLGDWHDGDRMLRQLRADGDAVALRAWLGARATGALRAAAALLHATAGAAPPTPAPIAVAAQAAAA